MFTGIVAVVGRIESIRPLGASADAGVRLTVPAGGLAHPGEVNLEKALRAHRPARRLHRPNGQRRARVMRSR